MKNKILFFLLLTVGFFQAKLVLAVCPVCTVAVAGGLGVSRWLGVDDFISAIWIGGLCFSMTVWSWNYLKKKKKLNLVTGFFALFLVYFSVIFPLQKLNFLGLPFNTLWGFDKIILGLILGTIIFWLGVFFNTFLKKKNEGRVYFPFQKVVMPCVFLLLASLIYYVYCKCVLN